MLRGNDGTLEAIEPDKLYRVVTGMYAGQMLGNVEATSMGLLTITPPGGRRHTHRLLPGPHGREHGRVLCPA